MTLRKTLFLILSFFILAKNAHAVPMKRICSEDKECCIYTADRRAHYVRYTKCPARGPVLLTVVDRQRVPLFRLQGFINAGYSVPEEFIGLEIEGHERDGLWVTVDRDDFFSVAYVIPLALKEDNTAFSVGNPARIYLVTPNEFLFQTRSDLPFFLEAAFDYVRIFAPRTKGIEIVALKDLDNKEDYFFEAAFEKGENGWSVAKIDPKSRMQLLMASSEYKHISEMSLREKQNYLLKGSRLVQIRSTDGTTARSEKETFIDLEKRISKTGWYLVGGMSLAPMSKNIFRVNEAIVCKQPFCSEFRDPLEVLRVKYKLDAYLLPADE